MYKYIIQSYDSHKVLYGEDDTYICHKFTCNITHNRPTKMEREKPIIELSVN